MGEFRRVRESSGVLGEFGSVWESLEELGFFKLESLRVFESVLGEIRRVYESLGEFRSVWESLGEFQRV